MLLVILIYNIHTIYASVLQTFLTETQMYFKWYPHDPFASLLTLLIAICLLSSGIKLSICKVASQWVSYCKPILNPYFEQLRSMKLLSWFISLCMHSVNLSTFHPHLYQVVSLLESCQVSYTTWVHIIKVLQGWSTFMRTLHQGGCGLGSPQHKPKAFLSPMKDNSAGLIDSDER